MEPLALPTVVQDVDLFLPNTAKLHQQVPPRCTLLFTKTLQAILGVLCPTSGQTRTLESPNALHTTQPAAEQSTCNTTLQDKIAVEQKLRLFSTKEMACGQFNKVSIQTLSFAWTAKIVPLKEMVEMDVIPLSMVSIMPREQIRLEFQIRTNFTVSFLSNVI